MSSCWSQSSLAIGTMRLEGLWDRVKCCASMLMVMSSCWSLSFLTLLNAVLQVLWDRMAASTLLQTVLVKCCASMLTVMSRCWSQSLGLYALGNIMLEVLWDRMAASILLHTMLRRCCASNAEGDFELLEPGRFGDHTYLAGVVLGQDGCIYFAPQCWQIVAPQCLMVMSSRWSWSFLAIANTWLEV